MIEIKNLGKQFQNETEIEYRDITFESGKSYILLGASGCGKSTLLNMIAGILSPSKGSIVIDGVEMSVANQKVKDKFRIGKIANTDENGVTQPGYFLYASDAENFIYKDGAQYNYGYKEGYFDSIVAEIEAVDKTAFADLVANVRKAEALAKKALGELENKNYTSEYKYVEKFGKEDWIFTLNKGEELTAEMQQIYMEFSNWLGSWEM